MRQPQHPTSQAELLDSLQSYLREQLACHTAILYGSRARDDWDAASDIDVVAFRDDGEVGHFAHEWQELFLDLFLERSISEPDPDWLRFYEGKILFQRDAYAEEVLAAVQAMYAAGPKMLSANE